MTKPMARSVVAPPAEDDEEPAQTKTTVGESAVGCGPSSACMGSACPGIAALCRAAGSLPSGWQHSSGTIAEIDSMTLSEPPAPQNCVAADSPAYHGALCRAAGYGR